MKKYRFLSLLLLIPMMASLLALPAAALETPDPFCTHAILIDANYDEVLYEKAAYEKAYDGSCAEWKKELREYLAGNRDLAEAFFAKIPEITTPHNEGTYLLWLDCSKMGVKSPAEFFLEKAHVKVCDGEIYGNPQCVRFNYGCPRAQLQEALARMGKAIEELRAAK